MKKKLLDEYQKAIASAGANVVSVNQAKNGHVEFLLSAPKRRPKKFQFALSPSCPRNFQNTKRKVKNWVEHGIIPNR